MPNPNFFTLSRPTQIVRTRSFTDTAQPGQTVTLSFKEMDALDGHAALDIVQEYVKRYVTGDEVAGTPPADFPAIGGRPVVLSHALCDNVGNLVAMQSETTEAGGANLDKLRFEDFVALSVTMPNAWIAILRFVKEIQDEKKSAQTDAGISPPALPSDGTDDTPNLTSEPTPS